MRLFVAVDPPEEAKAAVEEVAAALRDRVPGARWTRPEGRHLTLAFLGNVDEDLVGAIGDAVAEAAGGAAPFEVRLARGVGGFPDVRRPRVLWVGVAEGADALGGLAGRVAASLAPLGFEPQEREHHPHLTLARIPRPRPVGALDDVRVPPLAFRVGEVVLFRSQPQRGGARYTAMRRVSLD